MFGTDVGIVAYIELAKANGKTGRCDKWINLSEGVKLRVAPKTDRLCVTTRDVKLGKQRLVHGHMDRILEKSIPRLYSMSSQEN